MENASEFNSADQLLPASPAAELGTEQNCVVVEVDKDIVAIFGKVPPELDVTPINSSTPSFTEAQAQLLTACGNAATVAGHIWQGTQQAQGLYRLSSASSALLKGGATLAMKDGAYLGSIMKGGVIGQARFVPAAQAASSLVNAGTAVAMLGLQVQLHEISRVTRATFATTNHVLRITRMAQYAELQSLHNNINSAVAEAQQFDLVTATTWETIAAKDSDIRKQLELFQPIVLEHVRNITTSDHRALRDYLDQHQENIVADCYALLCALDIYTNYQLLKAQVSKQRSNNDPVEAQLTERILAQLPQEIDSAVSAIRETLTPLAKRLRMTTELSGPRTLPFTPQRRAVEKAKENAAKLLEDLKPLLDRFLTQPIHNEPPLCVNVANEDHLASYLHALSLCTDNEEKLLALTTAHYAAVDSIIDQVSIKTHQGFSQAAHYMSNTLANMGVGTQNIGIAGIKEPPADTVVVLTDKRVLTARAEPLREQAILSASYPLSTISRVDIDSDAGPVGNTTVAIELTDGNVSWAFPSDTAPEDIAQFTAVLSDAVSPGTAITIDASPLSEAETSQPPTLPERI